jgi:carboxymethylenebutenolidase
MRSSVKYSIGMVILLLLSVNARAESIYHEKYYPDGSGPFPTVIALHTSGGFKTVKHLIRRYVDDGFAVYAPDFFRKHGITLRSRMDTFDRYRKDIENELSGIVDIMKKDTKVDQKNVFAVGFSNGGFWSSYLAGAAKVNAGVSHYGVWRANMGREWWNRYPMAYFSKSSAPMLALHGGDDRVQQLRRAEEAWEELRSRGAKLETHIYPNARHAWDKRKSKKYPYNAKVDKDSHKRTIDFFRKNMQ